MSRLRGEFLLPKLAKRLAIWVPLSPGQAAGEPAQMATPTQDSQQMWFWSEFTERERERE